MGLGRVMTDMYEDDDAGLMIDAPDSGDEENPLSHEKLKNRETNGNTDSPKAKKECQKQSPQGTNGSGPLRLGPVIGHRSKKSDLFMSVDDDGLEEGEIPSEPVVKNFLEPVSQPSAKRRKVVEMVDASTCVTEADDTDEIPNMKQNQYYKLNVLILSRSATSSGHTFTFTMSIRGQTYHGVLTDGSPPIIHNNQIQKRAMAAEKEKGAEDSESSEKRDATPKPRGPKRSRGEDEKSPTKIKVHRHKSPHLQEITKDPYVRCPHKQCGFRFLAMNDLNNHLMLNHAADGVVLKEETATQTTEPFSEKCKTCEQREQKLREEMSINELFGGIKGDKNIKKEDDDEAAPKLEKEETTKERPPSSPNLEAVARDARLPTMPSITQRPEVNPGLPVLQGNMPGSSASVPPFIWNGGPFAAGFTNPALAPHKPQIPGFPSLGNPVNGLSPIPSSSKLSTDSSGNRHKLHELKTDSSTSSAGTPTTSTPSGGVQGRSITAGTSGNPMEMLLRPPHVPRPLSAAPSPATGPLANQLTFLQQQMLLRGLFPNHSDLNQFGYLNGQQMFPRSK